MSTDGREAFDIASQELGIVWHDPDVAREHADVGRLVGEDGRVDATAFVEAIQSLAETSPHLVAPSAGPPTQASGQPAGGSSYFARPQRKTDDELRVKYPALGEGR